jgi:hypothetical protein
MKKETYTNGILLCPFCKADVGVIRESENGRELSLDMVCDDSSDSIFSCKVCKSLFMVSVLFEHREKINDRDDDEYMYEEYFD